MSDPVETVAFDLCSCGTNEDLVVTGVAFLCQWPDGSMPWTVECWGASHGTKPNYLIDDEGRDYLFGPGWRQRNADAPEGG